MEYRRIRRYRLFLRTGRWIRKHCGLLFLLLAKVSKMWRRLQNRNKLIKKLDWYLIRKFIGTYIYSILLIITISIVFDVNENLAKFAQYHAPLEAIVFDYYANFIHISPISSVRFSSLSPLFSSLQSWQAIPRSLLCWHRVFHLSVCCGPTCSLVCSFLLCRSI